MSKNPPDSPKKAIVRPPSNREIMGDQDDEPLPWTDSNVEATQGTDYGNAIDELLAQDDTKSAQDDTGGSGPATADTAAAPPAAPLAPAKRRGAKRRGATTKRAVELTVWREVAELGRSIEDVAEARGLSELAVSKIIDRESAALSDRLGADLRLVAAQQTRTLEAIAREAIAAFQRSTRPQRSITRPLRAGESKTPGLALPAVILDGGTETISDPKGGEARHMDIALKALGDIRKIWGLEAPTKLDMIATVEQRPVGERLDAVTAELVSLLPRSSAALEARGADEPGVVAEADGGDDGDGGGGDGGGGGGDGGDG